MLVVTVEFVVRPQYAAEFLDAMIANAAASRREPGCRQFDVCRDAADPAVVFLYEIYDDRDAFDAHLATPHFRAFDVASAVWVARKSVRVYGRVHPAG